MDGRQRVAGAEDPRGLCRTLRKPLASHAPLAFSPRLSTAEGRNPAERRCLFGELMVVLLGLTLAVQPEDGSDEKSSQHR